jgi:hypothetical protein
MSTHRIAVIAGDGIGKEVMPEGLRTLQAAAARFGLPLEFTTFEWANCDYYVQHGQMMPADWFDQLKGFDAIYFGAVGWPDAVPDHISLWGSLIKFRREFDQYVNLRPVRLMPGVPCPLAGKKPGDIDFYVVRENTEGDIPPSAAACSRTLSAKSCCRKPCSPAKASIASCSLPSTWRSRARRSTSPPLPSRTASRSACRIGTSA